MREGKEVKAEMSQLLPALSNVTGSRRLFGGAGVISCLSSLPSAGAGGGEQDRLSLGDFSSVSPRVLSCACPDGTAGSQPPWPIPQLIGARETSGFLFRAASALLQALTASAPITAPCCREPAGNAEGNAPQPAR